jgi:hypothetical protein
LKHCAANRKRRLSALPNVGPYIYDVKISGLPKGVLEWRPPGKRKRGRPKLTWAEGIKGMMAEKGLQEEDWTDRNSWRKKI